MKDRFKFRAWIKNEKRYGYLLNLFNCGANSKKYEVEEYDEQGDYYTVYSSDEVVLQQCTGLKDKNGKLIFEGDIMAKVILNILTALAIFITIIYAAAQFIPILHLVILVIISLILSTLYVIKIL